MRIRWWIFAIRGRYLRCITMDAVLPICRDDKGNESLSFSHQEIPVKDVDDGQRATGTPPRCFEAWSCVAMDRCFFAVGGFGAWVIGEVMVHRAAPILKGRVIETLSTRFNSRVELDGFDVSLVKGLEVSGNGLRIFPQDEVIAAGATEPLITLGHFWTRSASLNGPLDVSELFSCGGT